MATPATAIASTVGAAVGAAASGPLSVVATFVQSGLSFIERFIPDPQQKLAAQQHLADQAQQLQLAAIDQQNKIIEAASHNISADAKVAGARAYLCYGIVTAIIYNIMLVPLLRAKWAGITPMDIPTNILITFAVIMLGFTGIPQAIDLVRTIMSMPGDSQVKLPFGLGQVGNKS